MSADGGGAAGSGFRLPLGRQVPVSSALGVVVFLAAVYSLAEPLREAEIFGAWALVYAVECVVRNAARWYRWLDVPEFRAAVLAGLLLVAGVVAAGSGAPREAVWALYAAVYLVGGWGPVVAGLQGLRRRSVEAELLMVIAALCAAGVGKPVDGALLFVIFVSSRALAALATRRTQESVRSLLSLTPEHVRKVVPGGDELVAAAAIEVDEEFLVRPGERIGADGQVVVGRSEVHQASITGEPVPVAKGVGDEVFAGTVNGTGSLQVRVTRPRPDSVLARIVATVQQASETKSREQARLELLERRYSLLLVAATLALILVPLGLGSDTRPTLLRAMGFMIVASPCALTLATMPALLAAIANAGRHGVLVKSAETMDRLGKVTTAIFDKTGSLTLGAPLVEQVIPLPGEPADADTLVRLAGAAERASEHPIARAIVAEAVARGLVMSDGEDFRSEPGAGVRAVVADHKVTVGSPASAALDPELETHVRGLERDGGTVVLVEVDGRHAGLIVLRDRLRPDAAAAVSALAETTAQRLVLLTGDGPGAARTIGAQVGIKDVRAQLLPEQKLTAVAELQAGEDSVAYIGDGVNDAPALATADVGVAIAPGADLALETADVVILRAELSAVPAVIGLSRHARQVIRQNLMLAGAVVVGLVTLDLVGVLPLPAAVGGHEGSTLLVALNGLRMLRPGAWRTAPVERDWRRWRTWQTLAVALALVGLGLLAAYSLGRYE